MVRDGRGKGKVSSQLILEARLRERDGRWLSSSPSSILGRYRGKYVAVRNKRIVAASSTMKGLYSKLDEMKPGMVLIAKVEKPALLVYG